MKPFLLLCLLHMGCLCLPAQSFTYESFDQKILAYTPSQRPGVSYADFEKGCFFLEETRNATKGDPAQLNVADYWNISMAFKKLQEPPEHLAMAFQKAIDADPASLCAYIQALGNAELDKLIPEVYLPFYETCEGRAFEEETVDPQAYAQSHGYDPALVKLMARVKQDDQQFRKEEGHYAQDPARKAQQQTLDRNNQKRIDSLYAYYQSYIGNSLVGETYASDMWSVIQHSHLEMMEQYLPVIHQAVKEEELGEVGLKMLIDRIYWLKEGRQIFGSQSGIPLASPKTREAVITEFGLN